MTESSHTGARNQSLTRHLFPATWRLTTVAQIFELVSSQIKDMAALSGRGRFPVHMRDSARSWTEFLDDRGYPRDSVTKSCHSQLAERLHDQRRLSAEVAEQITELLSLMLDLDPELRINASGASQHRWASPAVPTEQVNALGLDFRT